MVTDTLINLDTHGHFSTMTGILLNLNIECRLWKHANIPLCLLNNLGHCCSQNALRITSIRFHVVYVIAFCRLHLAHLILSIIWLELYYYHLPPEHLALLKCLPLKFSFVLLKSLEHFACIRVGCMLFDLCVCFSLFILLKCNVYSNDAIRLRQWKSARPPCVTPIQ